MIHTRSYWALPVLVATGTLAHAQTPAPVATPAEAPSAAAQAAPAESPATPPADTASAPAAPPTPTPAPEPAKPAPSPASAIKLEVHGFVGGSLYLQDAAIGPFNGGGALFVTGEPEDDKASLGGDVRQTRLNISATGSPILHGATPKGVIEVDLFGGNGAGSFGDVSVLPRLRLAYAELKWDKTKVWVGQASSLVLAMMPTSVGHIGVPLTWTAGMIGWRYPGIFVFHTVPLSAPKTSIELSVMVARPAWQNPSNAAFADTSMFVSQDGFGIGLGEASGLPQLEGRVKLTSPLVEGFAAGHVSRVDRTGTGSSTGEQVDLDVSAVNGGIKLNLQPVTLQASGYYGKNLAPLFGNLLQFQGPTKGDVREWGAWGQAGIAVDPRLSVWALAGHSRPKEADIRDAGLARLSNTVFSGMLRYQEGGYAAALELSRWHTRKVNDASSTRLTGDQAMLSGVYTF